MAERAQSTDRATSLLVGVGLLAAVLAAALLATGAIAGDAIAVYEPDAETVTAEPGETVAIDVVLRSDGGYGGEGIGTYELVAAIDPDVATIESVEPGPYLAGDGGEVEAATTTLEDGAVLIEHERVGADDGRTGAGVAATVTLRVREDAPAANATLALLEPETNLVAGDFRMRSFASDATVLVDGGGDAYEPQYEPEGDSDGGAPGAGSDDVGVTTASEANRSVDVDSEDGAATAADERSEEGEEDAVAGFGALLALLSLAVAATLVAFGGRHR